MKEADYKTKLVKAVREDGGYARRLEDQYAVGLPDMLLAVRGARLVFLVEAKLVKGAFFGPTPRQLVELQRICGCANEYVDALVIGFHPNTGVHYFGSPAERLYTAHSLSAMSYPDLLDKLRKL